MKKIIIIKCPNCKGPMWEEDLLDSDRHIDIVCIICGLRKFYLKSKYLAWRKKMENNVNSSTTQGRDVSTPQ